MSQLEKYTRILEALKTAEALKESAETGYAPQGWTEKQWDEIQLSDYLELIADTTVSEIRYILSTV